MDGLFVMMGNGNNEWEMNGWWIVGRWLGVNVNEWKMMTDNDGLYR